MRNALRHLFLLLVAAATAQAGPPPKKLPGKKPVVLQLDSLALAEAAYQQYADSVNATFRYQRGHLVLPGGIGELTVPRGFRYLDSTQAGYVLHRLWKNPPQSSLGMLFPDSLGPLSQGSWAYAIDYDPMGYVKDDDAHAINYDELLETMQRETEEGNDDRTSAGYDAVHLVGWGARPYYDAQQHALHWAKLLRFGNGLDETLNYNVRILGRRGVLIFNAIADTTQLPAIRASVPGLLRNVSFAQGQQYTDFNPGLDEVAAYTIGGLVAGKVLAKVGFLALIVKFWKIGLLALGGAWAAIKRFFGFGSKQE